MLAYFRRAVANLYAGSLPKALADLDQASKLDPTYAYAAIWLDILNKRSNLPSPLAQAVTQIDMTKWPAPVIRLYLGQSTPTDVLAAADDPDEETKRGQVCEANFYTGELKLQQGAKEEAARLFRRAAADCPKGFDEWPAANAELRHSAKAADPLICWARSQWGKLRGALSALNRARHGSRRRRPITKHLSGDPAQRTGPVQAAFGSIHYDFQSKDGRIGFSPRV